MSAENSIDPQAPAADEDAGLPLIGHLAELRTRLLKALLAVLVVFLGIYGFANELYLYVSQPLRDLLPEGSTMIATEVASPFMAPFKLALIASLCVAMPFVLYQIWSFIAPGLYAREKRLAIPLLLSSILLFYAGLAFAYYVVFPLVFGFFTSVGPESITVMTDINRYLDFILKLLLAFGFAFEIPVATVLLIASGAVQADDLSSKRPYVIIGCFAIGMLLTPPDVISQVLLAMPMWLLFESGLLISRVMKIGAATEEEPA